MNDHRQTIEEFAAALDAKMQEPFLNPGDGALSHKALYRAALEASAFSEENGRILANFEENYTRALNLYAESLRRISPAITADEIGGDAIAGGITGAMHKILKHVTLGAGHGIQ